MKAMNVMDCVAAPSFEEKKQLVRLGRCNVLLDEACLLRAAGDAGSAAKLEKQVRRVREEAAGRLARIKACRAGIEARRSVKRFKIGFTQEMMDSLESLVGSKRIEGKVPGWYLQQVLSEALFGLEAAGLGRLDAPEADSIMGALGWRFEAQLAEPYAGTRRRQREQAAVNRAIAVEQLLAGV